MKKITLAFVFLLLLNFSLLAQLTGYDLSNIVVVAGSENPIEGITSIEEDQFTEDISLDIVNWNVNWLGAPEMVDNKYGSRSEHINKVAEKLLEINADVYALQEVVVDETNGNALEELIAKMNELAGSEIFSGIHSTYHSFYWEENDHDFPPQCLAYIWKNEVISVNNSKALLEDEASRNDFGYGRLPFLLDATVTLNGKSQRYMFINLHLKAMTGFSDARLKSMSLLKELLYVNYAENNVVLLGDYNVADNSGAMGEILEWGMYNDNDGDGIVDYVHTAGNKNNGIEHILISNDLFDELAYTPEYYRNRALNGTGVLLSDHYAYQTRLYVYEETGGNDPGTNSLFNTGAYDFTMSTSDYQIIIDYVKNNPDLAVLDPSTYDDSEYYFGASSYYTNFDIRDDKHNTAFTSWEEAVKSAISSALLPAKFAQAEMNDSVYRVTFATYSGSNDTHTFNFECTKSAPDPEFSFTTRTSNIIFETSTIKVYPNPANNHLTISSNIPVSSYSIFNSNGQLVLNSNENGKVEIVINLTDFKNGIYLVKINNEEGEIRTARFLKK